MNSKKYKNGFAVSLTTIALFLSAGCGSNNSGTTTNTQPQSQNPTGYSYSLSEDLRNGQFCTYQSPNYSTIEEYCEALEDSNLNRDNGRECAVQQREQLFAQSCGSNWNPGNGGGGHPQPGPQPQPPIQSACTIRNGADASGRPVFNVVTQDGAILGTFQTAEQAAQFAESDPRCHR